MKTVGSTEREGRTKDSVRPTKALNTDSRGTGSYSARGGECLYLIFFLSFYFLNKFHFLICNTDTHALLINTTDRICVLLTSYLP